ncbi:hypothetical protein BSKO_06344 [Bryopsis sp. KO-2023]|nr:hypothetical protein BSKO_06344 [Bryopsis sp. KO-2023]
MQTLQRYPESILPAMCTDCHDAVGTGKEIHIDRSAAGFGWIMEIYRGCATNIAQSIPSDWGLADMENELNFYQLPAPDQLLPHLHGELLFRREKKALRNLGDKILAALGANEESIYFEEYVGFCVILEKPATLDVKFLGHDMGIQRVRKVVEGRLDYCRGQSQVSKRGIGKYMLYGVTFMLLSDNHLDRLKVYLRKFGFGVSQQLSGIPTLKSRHLILDAFTESVPLHMKS